MRYIGFDVGGTKCAVTVATVENDKVTFEGKRAFLTPEAWQEAVEQMFQAAEALLGDKKADACGFSCGSPLDAEKGIVLAPPNLPTWDHVPVTELARARFGIPAFLENDANACALAEWRWGAGRGVDNMIFLTFGTGMGAGLILDGRLIRGANGNAGEIGHVRLTKNGPIGYRKKGSCEGYCSGSGIVRLCEIMREKESLNQSYRDFANAVGEENISAKTIAEYARKNNRFCKEIFKKSGEMLGRTLSMIVDMLNPEKIIIGGIFMRANDLFTPYVSKIMKKECLSFSLDICKILPAKLSENIGDIAALSIAKGDF